MSTEVETARPDETVQEISKRMRDKRISSVIIVGESGEIEGIVSERDMVHKIVCDAIDPSKTQVYKIMTKNVITGNPDMTIVKVATILKLHGIKTLPIVEKEELVGITTQTDLLRILSYK